MSTRDEKDRGKFGSFLVTLLVTVIALVFLAASFFSSKEDDNVQG